MWLLETAVKSCFNGKRKIRVPWMQLPGNFGSQKMADMKEARQHPAMLPENKRQKLLAPEQQRYRMPSWLWHRVCSQRPRKAKGWMDQGGLKKRRQRHNSREATARETKSEGLKERLVDSDQGL